MIKLLQYLIGNIFLEVCGRTFQNKIGMPMETNSARLLVDLSLYSYEAEFIHDLK